MNHVSPYLFLSREDDDDVREIGKRDFRSVLLHPMISNANLTPNCQGTRGTSAIRLQNMWVPLSLDCKVLT